MLLALLGCGSPRDADPFTSQVDSGDVEAEAPRTLRAGDLRIVELNLGPEEEEWFELYNTTDRTLDLEGAYLGSGAEVERLGPVEVAPADFVALGLVGDSSTQPTRRSCSTVSTRWRCTPTAW